HFIGISTMTYVFVAITLAIIYLIPRFIKTIPAPLIAIIVLTTVAIYSNFELRTVGDLGLITKSLTEFFIPKVQLNFYTLTFIVLTTVSIYSYFELRIVCDLGLITKSLPEFFIPNVPLNFETLAIIFPYSIALSIVGLLETLLTSSIVDDMTDTDSDKNREAR